jgi:hypothetical protein
MIANAGVANANAATELAANNSLLLDLMSVLPKSTRPLYMSLIDNSNASCSCRTLVGEKNALSDLESCSFIVNEYAVECGASGSCHGSTALVLICFVSRMKFYEFHPGYV